MKVVALSEAAARPRRIAIGTFDGVHIGHRQVIDGADTVLTFEPHPVNVIHPESAPKIITPLPVKARLVEQLGVEELVVVAFNEEFLHVSAEQFVEDTLIAKLQAKHVSVGENFRFGFHAQGDPEMLARYDQFETRVVALVEQHGEIVSSTQIRGLVAAGNVIQAAEQLGYNFTMVGTVVAGDQRGRELGFPTANLVPEEDACVPGHGIYAALTNGMPSAVNVGVRPTFESGRGLLIESYLIDWEGDLYGQQIEVEFLKRLRGERRYESVDALVEQMHRDVAEARGVCATALARIV